MLKEATPKRLAAFAERGPEQKQLVDRLLADGPLMLQMVVADGAKGGEYGRAMEIYAKIQAERPKARAGAAALAVAIALGARAAGWQRNATGAEGRRHVGVARCHYEEAFEKGSTRASGS